MLLLADRFDWSALTQLLVTVIPVIAAAVALVLRSRAARERDAVIEGVERCGHAPTQAAIKQTARAAGAGVEKRVDKATERLKPKKINGGGTA